MIRLRKFLSVVVAAVMCACVFGALTACKGSNKYEIAVFAYKYDDSYIATVRTALEEKFKGYDDVSVTFYNGENNQQTQSAQIDTAITKGADPAHHQRGRLSGFGRRPRAEMQRQEQTRHLLQPRDSRFRRKQSRQYLLRRNRSQRARTHARRNDR